MTQSQDSGKETPASRIIEGAREALSIARGEQPAASITINGHKYVPASVVAALEAERDQMRAALEKAREWLSGWASADPYLSEIDAALQSKEGE